MITLFCCAHLFNFVSFLLHPTEVKRLKCAMLGAFTVHSIFNDNLMVSSFPNFFNNSETPIICYEYNKPIRSTIFNFNKIVTDININSNTPDSCDCQNSNYLYPPAGHVITDYLNVNPDGRVRNIISKGPKYRFPSNFDFPKCHREMAASLNDFGNRWCKRENVEPEALKEWKINIFKIIDTRISFYSRYTQLLPRKPNSSFPTGFSYELGLGSSR